MGIPLRDMAAKVPASTRRMMLEQDWIGTATVAPVNEAMKDLIGIWYVIIDPYQGNLLDKLECSLCRTRTLEDMKALLPHFIALENQSRMLKRVI